MTVLRIILLLSQLDLSQHLSGRYPTIVTGCPAIAAFFSTINLFLITNNYLHLAASIADAHLSQGRCHGCRQLWPPWRPYGHGPGGPCPLQQVHDLQPKEPRLAQPRSFRPLVRLPIFIYVFHTVVALPIAHVLATCVWWGSKHGLNPISAGYMNMETLAFFWPTRNSCVKLHE